MPRLNSTIGCQATFNDIYILHLCTANNASMEAYTRNPECIAFHDRQGFRHLVSLLTTHVVFELTRRFSCLQDPSKPIKAAVIADACLVVDVLGQDFRSHLIERYVALELKEYRRIFRTSDEAGQLDNISRRFAWFRRLLQTHELEQGRVFPAEWKVGWHLLAKFTEITRCVKLILTYPPKKLISIV